MPDGFDAPDDVIQPGPVKNGGWMVGPLWDSVHIIFAPLWWLAFAIVVVKLGFRDLSFQFGGRTFDFWLTFALTVTMAHVFSVVYRSHVNREVFGQFKVRFVVVPLSLFIAFSVSKTLFMFGMVFAVWFDNYHSSMQTFGYGRIYDMRAGNPPLVGRRLDMGMALLAYLGPILAGATFADSFDDWSRFGEVGLPALMNFPGWALQHQMWLTVPILVVGGLYVVFYIYSYWRLAQRGYRVSKQKVATWVTLVVVSVYTFGFNTFGVAFIVMECFHSWQYFATVWWSEKNTCKQAFHVEKLPFGKTPAGTVLTFVLMFGIALAFGAWTSVFGTTHAEFSLFLVVELMHYWYDGFIWSVRKKQVA